METMLKEIMVLRSDAKTGRDNLKVLAVDASTLSRLVCVRGNLYADNPRLRTVAMPTAQTPEMSPEMQARADAAFRQYLASKTATASLAATQPQAARPLTQEERWRCDPTIRKEFVSFASYAAYCRAVESGRCKAYGGA